MHHSRTSSRGWQTDVHIGLYNLLQSRAPLFGPRPATWGGGTPALGCTFGSHCSGRWDSSRIRHTGAHSTRGACSGRIAGSTFRVTYMASDCVGEQAVQAAECCYTLMRLLPLRRHRSRRAMSSISPLQAMILRQPYTFHSIMSQGQLISPFLCQLTVHGLPPSLAKGRLGHPLLSKAGEQHRQTAALCLSLYVSCVDLTLGQYWNGSRQPFGVGNADACMDLEGWPPPGDQELLRMPRSFCICERSYESNIARPGSERPLREDVTHS